MIYLDNAATTWPKPREILDQMVEIYSRIGVSPGRGSYDAAVAASDFIRQTRRKVAKFFGAPDPDRVIFTSNATDGLNMAIQGLVNTGDHVITTCLEHNSVLRPLYHLQQTGQVSCSLVSFDDSGFIDPEEIEKAIKSETKLVVMTQASNVLGTIQPVIRVGEICAGYGIPLLVDASQSAGQTRVNMTEMKASAVVFTGHKSLYGPSGIGGLILAPHCHVKPSRFGGTGSASKNLDHPLEFPDRLEAGTHNLMSIIGLSLALDYLGDKGVETIHEQEMKLIRRLYDGLSEIKAIKFYGARDLHSDRHLAILTANLNTVSPEDLGAILDGDFDIAVRTGLHCAPLVHEKLGTGDLGAVRFSLGYFNTLKDMDLVIKAMASIAASSALL